MKKNISDIDVTSLIPQKAPFVMVDKLYAFTEKEVLTGLTIKSDNIFTKNQVFTEPGLIEHMAQSVALHTGYQYFLKNKPAPTGYIGSIKQIEIKSLPKLDDKLKTKVNILHEIMGVTLVSIAVFMEDIEIAHGEMKTVIAS